VAEQHKTIHAWLKGKFFWDEMYDSVVVTPFKRLSAFLVREIDLGFIDFLVNTVAVMTETMGNLLKFMQTGYVRNYALALLVGMVILAVWLT